MLPRMDGLRFMRPPQRIDGKLRFLQGKLKSSWSYLRIVRLSRTTSWTSMVRAVQIPFTSAKSR